MELLEKTETWFCGSCGSRCEVSYYGDMIKSVSLTALTGCDRCLPFAKDKFDKMIANQDKSPFAIIRELPTEKS